MEGWGRDLIGAVSGHLSGGTEEDQEKCLSSADFPTEIRTDHLQSTNLDGCRNVHPSFRLSSGTFAASGMCTNMSSGGKYHQVIK